MDIKIENMNECTHRLIVQVLFDTKQKLITNLWQDFFFILPQNSLVKISHVNLNY